MSSGVEFLAERVEEGLFIGRRGSAANDYGYALRLARDLHQLFPENFLFHLNQGQILKKMGTTRRSVPLWLRKCP